MTSRLVETATAVLTSMTLLWTASSLSRLTLYDQVSIDKIITLNVLLLDNYLPNKSRLHCALRCDHHENCTAFLYHKANRTCALYGLDFPRNNSVYPKSAAPVTPWQAFYVDSGCPYNYNKKYKKCFLLLNQAGSHNIVSNNCSSLGGKLVQFSSYNELLFFQGFLLFLNGNKSMNYFVGAQISVTATKTFVWTNTTRSFGPGDPMWSATQPDALPGPNEDCVEASKDFQYLLNDVSCSMTKRGICEFPVPRP
ncbi:unnamed protein product [Lymnaea stagnalis]|uniref:C-type lectin domain-containing protein n=1 Tax=Lymnaea stagnalis TaxID=6523 RepID=A0AAV2IKY5_LYMST